MDTPRLRMKVATLLICFPVVVLSFSTSLLGKWRPDNLPNVMIHVTDESVVGQMDDKHSVEMKIIKHDQEEMFLHKIQLQQKPLDWFNVFKYKEYINIFRKVEKYGIVCKISFLNEKSIEIWSRVGKDKYQFLLEKILED